MRSLLRAAESGFSLGLELRRLARRRGWTRGHRVPARVISVGNLTVGGTGKTTLTLHLAERARAAGLAPAVVCRRYRPGPAGQGDEELMYRGRLGASHVFADPPKWRSAARAAEAGAGLVLVDDGFAHWALERDVDVVLVDATDPFGGGRLLPAGRLREPVRALERAHWVVVSRAPDAETASRLIDALRPHAPAARFAAGRHALAGVCTSAGERAEARGRAHVVTATGNPEAVVASARAAGFAPVTLSAYRDHHWFRRHEVERERQAAGDGCLLLTRKDAVRWPAGDARVRVLEVAWEWVAGGDACEAMLLAGR